MAGGTNNAVGSDDDEGTKELNQTMDYRDLMKNQANMGIDDDFGDMLVLPLPEEVFDHTYKACKNEYVFLQKYEEENDDGWCNTGCCWLCKVFWYDRYKKDFFLSRITIEDQGKILSVFGLEYFFVDRHGMNCDTLRHPLLFRKDGELTIQPRKVTYDLDGNAEIDKSDPEHVCKMRLQGKGIELKKIDMITGNEILECFIEYKSSTKTLSIDNIRTHMGSKTQIIGEYDLAPDREQKNKALLGITV